MPYIIDGHNLIPKIPGMSLQDLDDEIQLIKILQDFCRQHGRRVEVYFDNAPPGAVKKQKFGPVAAHFVRKSRTADAAIRSALRKMGPSARNYTVVTSDRAVAAAVKEAGAEVISSVDFADRLSRKKPAEAAPGKDPDISLNLEEVNEWMRLFGEGDEGS